MTSQPQAQAGLPTLVPINSPRNFAAYAGDMMAFMVGLNFIPTATVLVALASQLTDNSVLIGIVGMIGGASWFLPQLFAARIVHGKRRKKPYLIAAAAAGRQAYLLIALWLFITGAVQPILTVWILIAGIAVFHIADALAGVAWFDMLSRALTPRMRSRAIAIGEFAGSVLGIGAGFIVARILAPDGLPFPANYAVIITCAWLSFDISLLFILFIQENSMDEAERSRSTESQFRGHLAEALRADRAFRKLLVARGLTGLDAMVVPFYIVFITALLQLPAAAVGVFTVAYAVGSIIGIVFFGGVADRWGSLRVIHASAVMQFAAPALALLIAAVPAISSAAPDLAMGMFIVIMGLNGALSHSLLLGFVGYTLDASPERHRAIYVGVINTVGGLVSLTPVLAGVLIESLSRSASQQAAYTAVFGLAAVCVGAGMLLSFRLPRPIHPVPVGAAPVGTADS